MTDNVNLSKRRLLIAATTAAGGVAAAGAGTPFVLSLMPSERAKAAGAPVEVDVSAIQPGMMIAVEWQGKPGWIVRRPPEKLDFLARHDQKIGCPPTPPPPPPPTHPQTPSPPPPGDCRCQIARKRTAS